MALTPLPHVEVKERIELYLYSPSRPLWPVVRLSYSYLLCSSIHCEFSGCIQELRLCPASNEFERI